MEEAPNVQKRIAIGADGVVDGREKPLVGEKLGNDRASRWEKGKQKKCPIHQDPGLC